MLTKRRPGTAPHTTIGSLTMRTIPQPMRPEPDPGTSPEAEPEQDDGLWQVHGQGSATKSGPSQDHPILPRERTLKAET